MAESKLNIGTAQAPVRVCFVSVFDKKAFADSDEKYSITVLIPKSDAATIAKVNQHIEAAIEKGESFLKKKDGKTLKPNLKMPLRDGDEERDGAEFNGHYFINASSKSKPDCVLMQKDDFGKWVRTDKEDGKIYSGCYCIVSLNMYPFDKNGGTGVAAGLNAVMFVKDGERLSGAPSADEVFGDDEFDEDDLLG